MRISLVLPTLTVAALCNLAPEQSPQIWLYINALCALSSLALLIELLVATDDDLERSYASVYYLLWSFATTAVWCIEVALVAADEKRRQRLSFQTKIELLLALGFMAESLHLLYVWKIADEDVGGGKKLDALGSVLAYGFLIHQNQETIQEQQEKEVKCVPFKDDEEMNLGRMKKESPGKVR